MEEDKLKEGSDRPYSNIKTYIEYKKRFLDKINLTPEIIEEISKEDEVDDVK